MHSYFLNMIKLLNRISFKFMLESLYNLIDNPDQ